MNRTQLKKEIHAMRLPITALEELELMEFLKGSFDKVETKSGRKMLAPREHHFDTLNEMAFTGLAITHGMQLLYEVDDDDLTNYYASI